MNGHQPAAASVIGPAVPGQRQAGAAEEDRAGGSGAGVALALEGVRQAFDEAEAFVDKVCAGVVVVCLVWGFRRGRTSNVNV